MKTVRIGNHTVGAHYRPITIGEVGINHNGFLGEAFKLMQQVKSAGCDFVKFQTRTVPIVYSEKELATPRQIPPQTNILQNAVKRGVLTSDAVERLERGKYGADGGPDTVMTNGDLKYALEFTLDEYRQIHARALEYNLPWTTSPWDLDSVARLREFDLPWWKIASASLADPDLLRAVRDTGKPVILSTGMSTMDQIRQAVKILGTDNLVLMHTVSDYPAKSEILNLRLISTLRSEFPDVPVGYSGHEKGLLPTVIAVLLGASAIERHVTTDVRNWGTDQPASLERYDMRLLNDLIVMAHRIKEDAGVHDNIDRISDALVEVCLQRSPEQLLRLGNGHSMVMPSLREFVEKVLGDGVKRVTTEEAKNMAKLRRITGF